MVVVSYVHSASEAHASIVVWRYSHLGLHAEPDIWHSPFDAHVVALVRCLQATLQRLVCVFHMHMLVVAHVVTSAASWHAERHVEAALSHAQSAYCSHVVLVVARNSHFITHLLDADWYLQLGCWRHVMPSVTLVHVVVQWPFCVSHMQRLSCSHRERAPYMAPHDASHVGSPPLVVEDWHSVFCAHATLPRTWHLVMHSVIVAFQAHPASASHAVDVAWRMRHGVVHFCVAPSNMHDASALHSVLVVYRSHFFPHTLVRASKVQSVGSVAHCSAVLCFAKHRFTHDDADVADCHSHMATSAQRDCTCSVSFVASSAPVMRPHVVMHCCLASDHMQFASDTHVALEG
eukprot:PhM_4_TR14672/c6_g1_i1/m.87662